MVETTQIILKFILLDNGLVELQSILYLSIYQRTDFHEP